MSGYTIYIPIYLYYFHYSYTFLNLYFDWNLSSILRLPRFKMYLSKKKTDYIIILVRYNMRLDTFFKI